MAEKVMTDIDEGITSRVLRQNQKDRGTYMVRVMGKDYVVLPDVFSPRYFEDTEIFARNLPIDKRETLLEIGCGTGIISIVAVYRGMKKVVAVDINAEAVINARKNIELHRLGRKVEVREGDVFGPIKDREKFDLIFWNIPFCFSEIDRLSVLEKAVFDFKYQSVEKYIKNCGKHLKTGGLALIGFSSSLGKKEKLEEFAVEAGMVLQELYEAESGSTPGIKYEILSLTRGNY